MTSLGVFAGIREGNFTKLAGLLANLFLLVGVFVSCNFGVNLEVTHYLKVLFSSLEMSKSQPDL